MKTVLSQCIVLKCFLLVFCISAGELMSSALPLQVFSEIWQHFRSMDHTAVKVRREEQPHSIERCA